MLKMEQPCNFFTNLNFSFMPSARTCSQSFVPKAMDGFSTVYGSHVILWISVSVMGIGSSSYKHP